MGTTMTPAEVLAVMDEAALCLSTREDREEMREARAAVAALVAERDAYKAADESMQDSVGVLEAKLYEVKSENAPLLARIAELEAAIAKALPRAKVFDDGSDGADGESAASVVAILSAAMKESGDAIDSQALPYRFADGSRL